MTQAADWGECARALVSWVREGLAAGRFEADGVRMVLLRPTEDLCALELLLNPAWDLSMPVVFDATSFGYEPLARVGLDAWLDTADALTPTRTEVGPFAWRMRLLDPGATVAMGRVLDDLRVGMRACVLSLAAQLVDVLEGPFALCSGIAGEASLLCIASKGQPSPVELVAPVTFGGETAWAALSSTGVVFYTALHDPLPTARLLERSTVREVAAGEGSLTVTLTDGATLELAARHGRQDDEMAFWGLVESEGALSMVQRHLEGRPPTPLEPWQPAELEPRAALEETDATRQFSERFSAWLTEATASLAPSAPRELEQTGDDDRDAAIDGPFGAVQLQLWDRGVRLWFFQPLSLPSLFAARPLARVEVALETLVGGGEPPDLAALTRAAIAALPRHPSIASRAAGRFFVVVKENEWVDVHETRFAGRPWAPKRRASGLLTG